MKEFFLLLMLSFFSCKGGTELVQEKEESSVGCIKIKSTEVFSSSAIYRMLSKSEIDTNLLSTLILEINSGGEEGNIINYVRSGKFFLPIILDFLQTKQVDITKEEDRRWLELLTDYLNILYPEEKMFKSLGSDNCKSWKDISTFYNKLFDSKEVANMIPTFNDGPFYFDDTNIYALIKNTPIKEIIEVDEFSFENRGKYISFFSEEGKVYFLVNQGNWSITKMNIAMGFEKMQGFGYVLHIGIDDEIFIAYFNMQKKPLFYFQSW